jgi:hypothetical protein
MAGQDESETASGTPSEDQAPIDPAPSGRFLVLFFFLLACSIAGGVVAYLHYGLWAGALAPSLILLACSLISTVWSYAVRPSPDTPTAGCTGPLQGALYSFALGLAIGTGFVGHYYFGIWGAILGPCAGVAVLGFVVAKLIGFPGGGEGEPSGGSEIGK